MPLVVFDRIPVFSLSSRSSQREQERGDDKEGCHADGHDPEWVAFFVAVRVPFSGFAARASPAPEVIADRSVRM
jgi:hypothetical protein